MNPTNLLLLIALLQLGFCELYCTAHYDPVCSTENWTFSNMCWLIGNGHVLKHEGRCIGTRAPTTAAPTSIPTWAPTFTDSPTLSPTLSPTVMPTTSPTSSPTNSPSTSPTSSPTHSPSTSPTNSPTHSPSTSPTNSPTHSPTNSPTNSPTHLPTNSPTSSPTSTPTLAPTQPPTISPSSSPTLVPTVVPTTSPTMSPTIAPTDVKVAFQPSHSPTISPTSAPTASPSSQTGTVDSSATAGISVTDPASPSTWWPLVFACMFAAESHLGITRFTQLSSNEPMKRSGLGLMIIKSVIGVVLCLISVSMDWFGDPSTSHDVELILLLLLLGASLLYEVLHPQMFEELSLYSWNAFNSLFFDSPSFKALTFATVVDGMSLLLVGMAAFALYSGSSLDEYSTLIGIVSSIVIVFHCCVFVASVIYFYLTLYRDTKNQNGQAHFALVFEREEILRRALIYGSIAGVLRALQVGVIIASLIVMNNNYFEDLTLLLLLSTELGLSICHLMMAFPVSSSILGLLDTGAPTTLKVVHFS